jgi:hypothetical protein
VVVQVLRTFEKRGDMKLASQLWFHGGLTEVGLNEVGLNEVVNKQLQY